MATAFGCGIVPEIQVSIWFTFSPFSRGAKKINKNYKNAEFQI
uniref:Uncharacterized protein n=1 Tax=Rhizophora mucronata TaxID=61149 RepID=A0A2P2JYA1_RHIMU